MGERDNFIDCIRAMAATFVLLRHCSLLPGGAVGVSVFFCLSGFLIARILQRLPLSSANVGKFIFRRFMRVWPMMAFHIFLTLGLLVAFRARQDVQDYILALPGLLTFTGSVRWIGLSSGILWTLLAEFWFYVLFALALFAIGRASIIWITTSGIIIGWMAKFYIGHDLNGAFAADYPTFLQPMLHTFIYLDQLMVGAACAYVVQRNHPAVRNFFSNSAVSLWIPLFFIAVLATLRVKANDLSWYLQSSGAAYLTAVIILHQWANPHKGDYEPLATIGRISFSIYLLHAVVLDFFPWHIFPPALQFLTGVTVIVAASLLTYRWIEKPFIRISKSIAALDNAENVVADDSRLHDLERRSRST